MAADGEHVSEGNKGAESTGYLGAQALPKAVAKGAPQFTRRIILGNTAFLTDLPEGVYPFESPMDYIAGYPLTYTKLLPSALDNVAPGFYKITEILDTAHQDPEEGPFTPDERELHIFEGPSGKVVSSASFGVSDQYDMPSTRDDVAEAAFRLIGGVVEGSGSERVVKAVPTPNTVIENARKAGVEITMLPKAISVDSASYLEYLKEGKYVVPAESQFSYLYGIVDPVLSTLLLESQLATSVIQQVASDILTVAAGDKDQIADLKFNLIEYVDALDAITSAKLEPAALENKLQLAKVRGFGIGISTKLTHEVLDSMGLHSQLLVTKTALLK